MRELHTEKVLKRYLLRHLVPVMFHWDSAAPHRWLADSFEEVRKVIFIEEDYESKLSSILCKESNVFKALLIFLKPWSAMFSQLVEVKKKLLRGQNYKAKSRLIFRKEACWLNPSLKEPKAVSSIP